MEKAEEEQRTELEPRVCGRTPSKKLTVSQAYVFLILPMTFTFVPEYVPQSSVSMPRIRGGIHERR